MAHINIRVSGKDPRDPDQAIAATLAAAVHPTSCRLLRRIIAV